MLIGPNDFCLDICYQKNPEGIVKNHENDLLKVFRTLKNNLQRTMLNVVLPPCKNVAAILEAWIISYLVPFSAIEVLINFKNKPNECVSLHHFECPCFFGFRFQKDRQRYLNIIKEWNKKVIEVVNREEFHDREVDCKGIKLEFLITNELSFSGFHDQHSAFCKKRRVPKAPQWVDRFLLHVL